MRDIQCHTCGDTGVVFSDPKRGKDRDPCPDCYDPSPVNSWEVTEGVSAEERRELEWRQKEELR